MTGAGPPSAKGSIATEPPGPGPCGGGSALARGCTCVDGGIGNEVAARGGRSGDRSGSAAMRGTGRTEVAMTGVAGAATPAGAGTAPGKAEEGSGRRAESCTPTTGGGVGRGAMSSRSNQSVAPQIAARAAATDNTSNWIADIRDSWTIRSEAEPPQHWRASRPSLSATTGRMRQSSSKGCWRECSTLRGQARAGQRPHASLLQRR